MKCHVILIDDNPVDNIIHEQMLQNLSQDIEVSIVDDSKLALKFLKREFSEDKLDTKTIILLDEHMPSVKGLEIMEALKDLEMIYNSKIQVYFLTADTSLQLIEKAAIIPIVKQVIHKPLEMDFLVEVVS